MMRRILFATIGAISVVLSIVCFSKDIGHESNYSYYGGDAFTGIQQAGAQTSNNVYDLTRIVRYGFGSILLISGLTLITMSIPCDEKKKLTVIEGKDVTEKEPLYTVEEETEATE